ncbi:hypothetical protein MANAM107_02570 [Actinomyces capricornis]|uniref:Uncharacterized protein n=1 Tax=Actinomyces capricornis TaxID=2755559 RepID=A0ABN6K544_9ACTO|nr:hypothetical protein MANAM107_02570 [Actinomyces capricornis]
MRSAWDPRLRRLRESAGAPRMTASWRVMRSRGLAILRFMAPTVHPVMGRLQATHPSLWIGPVKTSIVEIGIPRDHAIPAGSHAHRRLRTPDLTGRDAAEPAKRGT